MPTPVNLTDGQSQSFTFLHADPANDLVVSASGNNSLSVVIGLDNPFYSVGANINLALAPSDHTNLKFSSTDGNSLTVSGDTSTSISLSGSASTSGIGGATIVIQPDVTDPAPNASFNVYSGSSLELSRSVAAGYTFTIGNNAGGIPNGLQPGTLKLDTPSAFLGQVNFGDGRLLLEGESGATDYNWADGILSIYGGTDDHLMTSLRLSDATPATPGFDLRLTQTGEIELLEHGTHVSATTGTVLTQHVTPPPVTQPTTPVVTNPPPTQPTTPDQPATPQNPPATMADGSTGQQITCPAAAYNGPVSGLTQQIIAITAQNLNILANAPGLFIHTGSGNDAIQAAGGVNVLDGGTGSNFLTAGTGTDTFFVDARGATSDTWSTVSKFHAGDAATLWGISPSSAALNWSDNGGAAGYTGLTLHATAAGKPTASITLAGFSQADMAAGRVTASFGHDAASGSDYLYVHAP